ncbi:hypothetical protein [Alkaliphilus peptidifermentans]|uniref:Uncharacterized protein n=1 Tax=Alkaliphilus peptidifermentans DSM 18978 TaxID=1120976 RepID=A0A1G5AAH7_9FIRM|nr:hypothetical protein [Alkaliphilus peptidifermentans]SCX74856.1 hypothetical protein SAMN03080606_00002 [Alkaliphilus peptidifermentans DSM 18978]
MNKVRFISLATVVLMLFPIVAYGIVNNYINSPIPSIVDDENNPTLTLMHRIYIENFEGGIISIVNTSGVHTTIGTVYRPASFVKDSSDGFWAAHYDKASDGTHSCVTAIGANALHIRTGPNNEYDPSDPHAWTPKQFSVGIKEDYDYAGGQYSNAMIYTSIPGGSNIFGGSSAPFVGNPVKYLTASGTWESLDYYFSGDYTKELPKRLIIEVNKPSTLNGSPDYIEFENWAADDTVGNILQTANGRVLVHYPNGTTKHIADVIQRVQGTGRFSGTEYAEVGRVRAAHPGVICFSTSPRIGYTNNTNLLGGFQFIPANHAKFLNYDLNQNSFIGRDQWGIIAHVGAASEALDDPDYIIDGEISYHPVWEGVAPLFAQYIKPRHIPNNQSNSTYFEVSDDFGTTWNSCPQIQGVTDLSTNSPVAGWTNIRLYLNY